MPWAKVDDGFHSHPKVVGLDLAAVGLWIKGLTYCAFHCLDGALPGTSVDHLTGLPRARSRALAGKLVEAGLWNVTATGYQYHDWAHYQPMKVDVENDRAAWRERQKRHRNATRDSTTGRFSHVDVTRDTSVSHGSGHGGSHVDVTRESPVSRPVPSRSTSLHADAIRQHAVTEPPEAGAIALGSEGQEKAGLTILEREPTQAELEAETVRKKRVELDRYKAYLNGTQA